MKVAKPGAETARDNYEDKKEMLERAMKIV
jgi:hypothetical protein